MPIRGGHAEARSEHAQPLITALKDFSSVRPELDEEAKSLCQRILGEFFDAVGGNQRKLVSSTMAMRIALQNRMLDGSTRRFILEKIDQRLKVFRRN